MFGGFLWNKNCLKSPKSAHFCIEKISQITVFFYQANWEKERKQVDQDCNPKSSSVQLVPGHQLRQ